MTLLGLGLASLIGISLGLLGGGGSTLAVPIFVYVLGFGAKEAIATSLAVVGATSLVGALRHGRAGNVRWGVAVLFGAVAMVGAYGGALLARWVSGEFQLALFGGVALIASVFMFRGRRRPARGAEDRGSAQSGSGLSGSGLSGSGQSGFAHPIDFVTLMPAALAVGVMTGLVGVGGGFLIVPALVLLAHEPMHRAVGTSLVVIAMNAAAGVVGYLGTVSIPWLFASMFAGVAILGTFAGARLSGYVPERALRRGFAVFLLLVSIGVLVQNAGALADAPASAGAQQ